MYFRSSKAAPDKTPVICRCNYYSAFRCFSLTRYNQTGGGVCMRSSAYSRRALGSRSRARQWQTGWNLNPGLALPWRCCMHHEPNGATSIGDALAADNSRGRAIDHNFSRRCPRLVLRHVNEEPSPPATLTPPPLAIVTRRARLPGSSQLRVASSSRGLDDT